MTLPSRYGQGAGPYKLIAGNEIRLHLSASGVNVSKSPTEIEEGESPNAVDVRLSDGGVSTDYGLSNLGTAYGGIENKTIIGLAEFTRKNLPQNNRLVRMRPTGWDRWDGNNWLTLSGSLNGIATDRLYTVAMQDLLITANKVDKLKAWDGQDGSPVADLSVDAPIAWFIVPIGNRLMAARIRIGSDTDPYAVRWCADGNVTNWTNPALGAGLATLEPEGRGGGPDFIMGLAGIETAAVLFRQRSIVMAVRTGIGAQPFRFATVVFGLGTEAPYTVASAGHAVGTIFLGTDLNIYLFDGQSAPVPIGDPIRLLLKGQIQDPALCVGAMDARNLQYWFLTKRGPALPDMAWIFDVRALVRDRRLSWRRKELSSGFSTVAFSKTALQATPFVNDVNLIVDTVGIRVDDFGLGAVPERIVLGGGTGQVSFSDETAFLTSGVWESKMLGDSRNATQLDRTYLMCASPTGGEVEVSLSTDGGLTWGNAKIITVQPTAYARPFGTWFDFVLETWQYRLRILSGNITISEIRSNVSGRGPIGA